MFFFLSNRRPPAEVPGDALIIRSNCEPLYTTPIRQRKKKLGLGQDPKLWIDKIRRDEILPCININEKVCINFYKFLNFCIFFFNFEI